MTSKAAAAAALRRADRAAQSALKAAGYSSFPGSYERKTPNRTSSDAAPLCLKRSDSKEHLARMLLASCELHAATEKLRQHRCTEDHLEMLESRIREVEGTRAIIAAARNQSSRRPASNPPGSLLNEYALTNDEQIINVSTSDSSASTSVPQSTTSSVQVRRPSDRNARGSQQNTRHGQPRRHSTSVATRQFKGRSQGREETSITTIAPAAPPTQILQSKSNRTSSIYKHGTSHTSVLETPSPYAEGSQQLAHSSQPQQSSAAERPAQPRQRTVVLRPFSCPAESEGSDCACCLAPMCAGDALLTFPCGGEHVFHADCLLKWMEASVERSTCPLCRSWAGSRKR